MALVYPVPADTPDADDGTEPDFAELAADLSDTWLVEVGVGEDGDDACFGPLTARAAWDLAVEPPFHYVIMDSTSRPAVPRMKGSSI